MGNLACKSKVKVPIVEVPCSAVHEHLIKCMKQYNGAIAQVDAVTGETITFDAILERAAALAAGLTARGLRVGEAAVIIGENNVHYPWVLLGVLQTGASAHLLDPRSTPREVKHALSISKPVVAMVSSGVSQIPGIADELRASTGMRCILVWGSNGPEMPEDPARGQSDVNQYEGDLPDGISSLERLLASPVKSAISVPDSLESLETTETPLCLPETPTHSARVCAEAPPPMLGDMVLGPTPRGLGLLPRAPPSTPTHVSGSFGDSDSTTRSGDSSSLQQRLVHPSAVDRLTQPGLGQAGSPGSAVALILSSSGSTGMPKGVMITHDNLLAALELGPIFIKDDDVIAGVSPYFHAFGGLLMLMALCQGTPVVVIGKFSMSLLFDTVEKYKITALHVVTSVLVSLNKAPKEQLDRLESVRRIWSGAAQIAPLVQCSLQSILPDVLLGHSYGMTETTFTPLCGDVRADKPGSPGTLVPFMECRVVDPDTGMVLPRGCRGELHFRGPMVARGYLNNAEATAEAFDEDGWLKSGDLGFVDEDGYHYIVERLKDVLKYNGHQISPSELEALLMTHPAVQEAAIVGEPHEYGEAPRALVVLAEGQQVTEEELVTFIAGKVAPHKLLRGGVKFVTSPFPRTTSGKLQRKKLRALLEDDLNDSSSSETATVTTDQELSEAVAALSLDGLSDPSTPLQPSPDQRSISSE